MLKWLELILMLLPFIIEWIKQQPDEKAATETAAKAIDITPLSFKILAEVSKLPGFSEIIAKKAEEVA